MFIFTSECSSPGNTLTFECFVNAGNPVSSIVWQGTAFQRCEITLLGNRFNESVSHFCNNGTIVGWNVVKSSDSDDETYTSRLNITVTSDMTGKDITCSFDDGIMQNPGSMKLIKTGMQPAMNIIANLSLTFIDIPLNVSYEVDSSEMSISFDWSHSCAATNSDNYNILASNCGSCPTTTNHTNVTCTDVVPISGRQCTFAVQTVVCGNVTGNASDPISILFYELTVTSVERQQPTEIQGTYNSDFTATVGVDNLETNTAAPYIITIGFLIATLLVCVVVSITAIAIILRSKAKINAALESHRAEGTAGVRDEPMYEDVTGPLPLVSVINTQDNVAYGHTRTTT